MSASSKPDLLLPGDDLPAPRVLTLYGGHDASTMWRVYQPATYLERCGYQVHFAPKDDMRAAQIIERYDALVLPRLSWPRDQHDAARRWIEQFKRLGKVVIYECDDDQFISIGEHLTGDEYAEQRERCLRSVETLRLCDACTVSTQRLATTVRSLFGGPVEVVPNAIDLDWFRGVQDGGARLVDRRLALGWVGARRQDADFVPLADAWERIAARFPRVQFVIAGHCPDVLRTAIPADRLTVLPWVRMEEYPRLWLNVDIACLAVADNQFNRSKSNIKAQEAGASGCAVVASPVLYKDIIRANDNGLLAETAGEWEGALARLITKPTTRRVFADRLSRQVEERWSLERNAGRWLAAWSRIIGAVRARRLVA